MKSTVERSLLFFMGMMCAFASVIVFGRGALVRVFSDVNDVIRIGKAMILIFALGFPFLAARFILASFFQGLGRDFAAFVINFYYILLFAMPLALLLSRLIGLQDFCIGIISGNLLSSALGAVWATAVSRRL